VTTLNLAGAEFLALLEVNKNDLSSLDVFNNSKLKNLEAAYNRRLASLDVSRNVKF
jgi:hypothetical protein